MSGPNDCVEEIAVGMGAPTGASRTVAIIQAPFSAALVQDYLEHQS